MRAALPSGIVLLMIVLPGTFGCGPAADPHGRLGLKGTVTFQGQPLDLGSIRFLPLENQELNAGALIRHGKYEVPREQGLLPGTYRVEISAPEQGPPPGPPGADVVEPARDRIPAEFNLDSRL